MLEVVYLLSMENAPLGSSEAFGLEGSITGVAETIYSRFDSREVPSPDSGPQLSCQQKPGFS